MYLISKYIHVYIYIYNLQYQIILYFKLFNNYNYLFLVKIIKQNNTNNKI